MPEKTTPKEHGKKTAPPSEKEAHQEVVIHMVVSELPAGYEYIGDLPDDAANDTGLAGCKMYVVKELNSLSDFYLYQETESTTNENETPTKQTQWNYVRWVLRK